MTAAPLAEGAGAPPCSRCEEFARALSEVKNLQSPLIRGLLKEARAEHMAEHRRAFDAFAQVVAA